MAHPVENPIPITHCSQLQDNPSLGLPLQDGSRCESCGATQLDKCEGHFGFIKLPEPIYHPSHIAELGKILNLVCLCCLRLKKPKVRTCQPAMDKNPYCSYKFVHLVTWVDWNTHISSNIKSCLTVTISHVSTFLIWSTTLLEQ